MNITLIGKVVVMMRRVVKHKIDDRRPSTIDVVCPGYPVNG